ncbi:hypothetical protein QBC38DRAFT_466906 [Podospora fimiseda]|uniref:RRM domain-containing protein n=1 Tax=Podospora fimiseda TaxID=252190 RepID=A0AAN7BX73_9PEZI|nr:hypothetical protein QBC38DRAFT_466906 [Podospora fimiseda]
MRVPKISLVVNFIFQPFFFFSLFSERNHFPDPCPVVFFSPTPTHRHTGVRRHPIFTISFIPPSWSHHSASFLSRDLQTAPKMDTQQSSHPAAPQDFSRIYVGSLDYFAKPTDVEGLLNETGLSDFEKIHLSIDPISGRNPGYCFVEFGAHGLAAQALDQLAGKTLLGRTLKLGPCYPKGTTAQSTRAAGHRPTFQRWGDWKAGQGRDDNDREGPNAAIAHFDRHNPTDGTRVRVDGLPNMIDQASNDSEIRSIFAGYDLVAIGKRVIPYSLRGVPGNHHHCYVDFSSKEEAQRAIKDLDGTEFSGGVLKTSIARPNNRQQQHQQRGDQDGQEGGFGRGGSDRRRQQGNSSSDRAERNERGKTIMEASSWRRG